MYSLLSGFWRMMFAKVQYQVLILGLDDSGKTTLLEQLRHLYTGSSPPIDLRIPPTVGLNIGRVDIDRAKIVFWDLGGQTGLRVLWDKYFSDAHAMIYVIDSTDTARLDESLNELSKLTTDPELLDAPILVFANKQDQSLVAMKGHELESKIKDFCSIDPHQRPFRVQETSALTGDGITKGVEWLLKEVPRTKRTQRLEDRS